MKAARLTSGRCGQAPLQTPGVPDRLAGQAHRVASTGSWQLGEDATASGGYLANEEGPAVPSLPTGNSGGNGGPSVPLFPPENSEGNSGAVSRQSDPAQIPKHRFTRRHLVVLISGGGAFG